MAYVPVNIVLDRALPPGGIISIPYPEGKNEGCFYASINHNMAVEGVFYRCPRDFLVHTLPDRINITWRVQQTIPAGTYINLQFEEPLGDIYREQRYNTPIFNTVLSQTFIINFAAPRSENPHFFVQPTTVASPRALTLDNERVNTARNVVIHSDSDNTHVTFKVEGEDAYNRIMVEHITGPQSNGESAGNKAFTRITRISTTDGCNGEISVGTGRKLGFPVFVPGPGYVLRAIINGEEVKGGDLVAGDVGDATATSGDRRGTYTPPDAVELDGKNTVHVLVSLYNPGNIGSLDYAG